MLVMLQHRYSVLSTTSKITTRYVPVFVAWRTLCSQLGQGTSVLTLPLLQGWEPIVEEHNQGVHYWAWRRYLRRGLYMYRSRQGEDNVLRCWDHQDVL